MEQRKAEEESQKRGWVGIYTYSRLSARRGGGTIPLGPWTGLLPFVCASARKPCRAVPLASLA